MMVVLLLGSTYLLARQMSSASLRLDTAAASTIVLAQAKQALIGYAALDSNHPGALPCPDVSAPGSATEGSAAATCASASQRIGRLPWKTLGLPDLRDYSGERLWYALSNNFRDASGMVINSETLGSLTITGTAPATQIIAIVFAPGAALNGQNRSSSGSNQTTVSNYLEGANSDVANDDMFASALGSDTFNDALLPIAHADLFTVVENIVAKRLEADLKPFIQSYVTQWGAYPFAVSFTTPSTTQNNYYGTASTTYGLLPVTLDPAFLTWRVPAASEQLVVQTGLASGTATGTVSSNCTTTTSTTFRCAITQTKTGGSGNFTPKIAVTATLQNVGMALVDYTQIKVPAGSISYSSANAAYVKPSWSTNSLRTDGGADMLFTNGTLRGTTSTRNVTLTITWSGSTSQYLYVSGQPSDWFFTNQWYRMTYYSMSTGYAPGQAKSCVAGGSPLCLTVNNLTTPNNDKGALLVLAGRAVNTQTRPSSTLSNYFEGENVSPSDRIFETNNRSASFNDKIVILAP